MTLLIEVVNPFAFGVICSILGTIGAHASEPPPPVPAAPDPAAFAAPDTSPLVHEGVINAPIAEVWKGISTAEGYKMWGVAQCEFDLRIGGKIRTHYDPKGTLGDEGTIEQEVLAFEPERMLAFRVSKPPTGFPFKEAWKSTWSVITLTDLGDNRTHMRLAGLGYTADAESQAMRKFFLSGNEWSIKRAQTHFDSSARPPSGPAHAQDPLADIALETVLPCPRDAAWQLISTSDGWRRAMGVPGNIELRPGGPFELYFRADGPEGQRGSEGCTVLGFVPGELLSFTWNAPPMFAHARSRHTWVVIRLDEAGPTRTRLRLSHLGFAGHAAAEPDHANQWKEVREYFADAWPRVLEALRRTAALDRTPSEHGR
ncbi:MAG: SRPBCC domain-containing protein [Phycisphaeraceae bacterium]|nr:SRPBCC domain-containing protein [Phycisphaeraceae bacterium]